MAFEAVNRGTRVQDVISNPVFEGCGRLIFPVDRQISDDLTLENVEDILIWYNDVNPDKTVEIVNYLGEQAAAGNQIFYDIYTKEEKEEVSGKGGYRAVFLSGRAGRKGGNLQCRRRFCLCGGDAGQFPPRPGAVKKWL